MIENPFYFLNQEYEPVYQTPYRRTPEGFADYLNALLHRLYGSRRDDTIKCRQLLLRATTATGYFQVKFQQPGFETRGNKMRAQKRLISQLLDECSSPLHPLLKDLSVSEEQREEMLDLFALASEFSTLCGVTDKEVQVRLFETLPLYDYGGQQNRLMSPHCSAHTEKHENEDSADRNPEKNSHKRPAVIVLRPAFSYLVEDQVNGPLTNEHVICKTIVVVAETKPPVRDLDGGIEIVTKKGAKVPADSEDPWKYTAKAVW
ncbi:hypothetical protein BDW69DRAFT_16776 [Aspergillus filifer]